MNTKWLIRNWFRVGRNISWKLNFEVLASLLYFHPVFQRDWVYGIVEKKHKYVLDYLRHSQADVIEKYRNVHNCGEAPEKRCIWVMWWQGEEGAPALIRMCLDSIRRNANGADVVLITKNNYRDYADIPSYIIEKHEKGYISFAQLSDIMRVFLISKHGGLWLDATIYVSSPIPESIFRMSLYSLHTPLQKTPFVQNGRIHCFVLGGTSGSKVFEYVKDMLSAYWCRNDVIIDYYLLDYTIMLGYWTMDDIRSVIDSLPYTSDGLYELESMLDQPADVERLNSVLSDNLFSKLVWNRKHEKPDTIFSLLMSRHSM